MTANVTAWRIPHDQTSGGSQDIEDSYIIVASERPHDETREFDAFRPPQQRVAEPRRPEPPQMVTPRVFADRPSQAYKQPHRPPLPPPGFDMPLWLNELFSFRRQPTPLPIDAVTDQISKAPPQKLRELQHTFSHTLLRAIETIQATGEINAKLLLSRQSPENHLSDLIGNATVLALECFSHLPPFLSCLSAADLTEEKKLNVYWMPETHSLPHSVVCVSNQGVSMSAPPMGSGEDMHSNNGGGFDEHAPTAPPLAAGGGPYFQATPLDYPSVNYPGGPAGVFCPPMGSTPYGLPFHGRHRGKTAFEGVLDLYAGGLKKMPSVGDRPLTPPAQGWYAKYSSGVTGVVWDRVHQAWVVSWTLAGKRTFRHFTCKSFGGFDKAREAAIEFRLARNRDIAAYNKRYRERR